MRYIRFDHEICVYSYSQYSLKVHYMHIHNETIWATVNIWYIAPSHQCLKSVLLFFRFWHISKCYSVFKSVLPFSKPQLNFKKIKMYRILLSINLNFGCSSYRIKLTIYNEYLVYFCIYIHILNSIHCK